MLIQVLNLCEILIYDMDLHFELDTDKILLVTLIRSRIQNNKHQKRESHARRGAQRPERRILNEADECAGKQKNHLHAGG